MRYTLTLTRRYGNEIVDRLVRRRRDAAAFQWHRLVYEAAEAQGKRDTQAAWDILHYGLKWIEDAREGELLGLWLGDYEIRCEIRE